MDGKIQALSALPQKDKGSAFLSLLSDIFSDPSSQSIAQDIHALVDHLISQDPGIIVGRQVLSDLVQRLSSPAISDLELRKSIIQDVLDLVQPRLTTYEEQARRPYRLRARR
jgi:COP9 signalosome complex subunit 4